MPVIKRVAQLKTPADLRAHLHAIGADIPFDQELTPDGPLARTATLNGRSIGNRFCILPMEGWDANPDGTPSELTLRRWRNFGRSGAKLIWGAEAAAVRPDGRANPNQLIVSSATAGPLAELRNVLVEEHRAAFGRTDDLVIGLQLTHSGRFARPNDKKRMDPKILYRHPVLDRKFGLTPDYPVMTDSEVSQLIGDFVTAAKIAADCGFDFVDVKHCHGYLGHEFLSAIDRPGHYGGSFENRTRFLTEIVSGIRHVAPKLEVGVRLSAIDFVPFKPGPDGTGEPDTWGNGPYRYAFGGDGSGVGFDLTEPIRFVKLLENLGVKLVCTTAGSPYYVPHIQRPAVFPPSDGYQPPEEPLVGVARQIDVTAQLKAAAPGLLFVGSGYTYLQEWLPRVGQATVAAGMVDFIGLGRLVLSYPELPADVIAGRELQFKKLCRTFSDCTTAPRNGLVSGCYPLDPFYKARPEAKELAQLKKTT
ncbi:MAG: NADH:flavin oxidoreductase [Fimbriiglobus sp.]|nr:NADH:flavin oxidoreductase [Fimbriiglobus sp.]